MKDQKDTGTADIFTGKNRAGRPRKHIDQAAKQRAYRNRLKEIRKIIT
jgi:hypothetical protein